MKSVGILIRNGFFETDNKRFYAYYLYNIAENSFLPLINVNKNLFEITYTNLMIQSGFHSSFLTRNEQIEFIQHIMNTFDCINFPTELKVVEITPHSSFKYKIEDGPIQTEENKFKFQGSKNKNKMNSVNLSLTFKRGTKEEIFQAFRFLLKIAERIEAVNYSKPNHIQQKQINAEIECMPNRGVVFQECKEDFESRQ